MSEKWIFKKKQLICYSIIFLIYLLILLSFFSEAIAEPVDIPDSALRAAVETALGKNAGDTITQAEMGDESFKIFPASKRNISDLTGLEYATSLQYVYLEWNSISDISPLSNLTGLEHLHLENNQISDISPLSNITALQSLNISYNNLTSLDGLPDLSLTYALFFHYNQITNIKPLIDHTELTSVNNSYSINLNLEGNPLDDDSVNVYFPTLFFDRNIDVTFTTTFLKKVSGDNQTATTNTKLQPFVIEIVNYKHQKLSGVDVRFELTSGSGNFANGSNKYGYETLETTTNADGKASATLTTGSKAGTYRISVHAKVVHSRHIGTESAEPFTLTVIETTLPPQQQQETLTQQETQQQQEDPQEQEQPSQQEQEGQQQSEPDAQQEPPSQQQQEQPPVDESDTDTPKQQQEPLPQQELEEQGQQQSEPDAQQEPSSQQQQEQPPVDESDTDTPKQQQELLPQQELEEQGQQQSEPDAQPEPNYTIIPFDYEKEGVGKVVFSELMLTRLGKYPQWIELYNTTDQDIDINGWKIVGRYLDDSNTINILESQVISKSFTIKGKETVLIVSFATPNSRDRISKGLADKVYALKTNPKNFWNYKGLVLELQDAEGNPIDRIGNLNEADEVVWEIPMLVRNKRISLIRRLKPIRSQAYNFTFGIQKFGWFPAEKVKGLTENRIQYYYGRYTDIGSPGYRTEDGEVLPVTLSSFSPQLNKNGQIILSWITESELENAGFNILRSQSKQGPFVKVNTALVQGAGTTGERSSYTWKDTTAKPNVEYYYRIEDVSYAGKHQTLTTTRLKGLISVKNRFTTRWAQLKARH